MHGLTLPSALIASLSAIGGLASLGATLLVGPGAASPLPVAPQVPASVRAVEAPRAAQVDAAPAKAAETAPSGEPRRTVRIVYVGPITAK